MRSSRIFYMFLVLFFAFNVGASEIDAVIRDFYYPNIFVYKERLIEKSTANAFDFEDVYKRDEQPEIFIIKILSDKMSFGKNIQVIFEYKAHNSSKLYAETKNLIVKKKKHKVEFVFSSSMIQKLGRVELWNAKLICDGKEVSKKSSNFYNYRK